MSFLDLYEGDQAQAARMQPNEGTRLPSGLTENFDAAWSEGKLFSQSIAQLNARGAALDDYADEVKRKTGIDVAADLAPKEGGAPLDYDAINKKIGSPDIAPLSDDEIDHRALAKSQAAHRTYETLQSGERTAGGSFGSFMGSAASAAADPINIVGLAIAPETGGIGILSSALRWGALAGVSQAAIEAASDTFKEQVQPGYMESGQPLREIGGAFLGGAALGGTTKALGNAWTKVKTGQWPTSVRDAGNVIESEANVANTNPFPGVEGEVAHRAALGDSIDAIMSGKPVDVSQHMTPELHAHFDAYHGSPHDFDAFDSSKIGTGEGAQAYGHGLYFAESPSVADTYRPLAAQGRGGGTSGAGINLNDLGGNLYRVRITADKERMLDLDKPMSEQSDHVRAVMKDLGIPEELDRPLTGEDAYRRLGLKVGPSEMNDTVGREAAASKALSEAGIPGIKYLDGESRGRGEGTSNFVVFDDKHVEITHKNGKPVNAETRQNVVDQAMGLPPKQAELPLAPETEPMPPKIAVEPGPRAPLQTPQEMADTLTAPDHQDAIRADIDRERAMGDFKVPGVDENGNHTMASIDAEMEKVDAYKKLADDIQACANPPAAEAAE